VGGKVLQATQIILLFPYEFIVEQTHRQVILEFVRYYNAL